MNTLSKNGLLMAIGLIVALTIIGTFTTDDRITQGQVIGFGSMICVSLLSLLKQINTDEKTEEMKIELVKQTESKLVTDKKKAEAVENLTKITQDTNTLVNTRTLSQLKITSIQLQRLADLTKEPADIEAARIAKEEYEKQNER